MGIKIRLGLDNAKLLRRTEVPVVWDSDSAINGHIMIVGDSGMGKTHQLRKIISGLYQGSNRLRVHVFDIHGDIKIPGESVVKFSETTDYGFNPLAINPDPDFGGVRKQIQRFISGVNKTSRKLGTKQEAVLRYILLDLYQAHGFLEDEPATWRIRPEELVSVNFQGKDGRIYLEVPFAEKDLAKSLGCQFDAEAKCWWIRGGGHIGQLLQWGEKVFGRSQPTLSDAVRFCRRKLEAVFVGANGVAVNHLKGVNSKSAAYHRKVAEAMRRGHDMDASEKEKLEGELNAAIDKAADVYRQYLESIRNGREMSDVIRYDSADVLKSVYERLDNLRAIGIFRAAEPPFDRHAQVWRYDIKCLSPDEQLLFVNFKLESMFSAAIQRGEAPENDRIREVIALDEAHRFSSDEDDNIVNRIAKELRKFGVGLICATQSPTHFSNDFLTNVAMKMILPLDPSYWDGTARKLSLEKEQLKSLIPHKTILVHIKERGRVSAEFTTVVL